MLLAYLKKKERKELPRVSQFQSECSLWSLQRLNSQRYLGRNLETGCMMGQRHTILRALFLFSLFEFTLCFLFNCQFNWFAGSEAIILSHGLDKPVLLFHFSPCSRAAEAGEQHAPDVWSPPASLSSEIQFIIFEPPIPKRITHFAKKTPWEYTRKARMREADAAASRPISVVLRTFTSLSS